MLFDIDGTLIDSAGVGLLSLREGFFDAFEETRSRPDDFPRLDLGGCTDHSVAIEIFRAFGIGDTDTNRNRFYEAYSVRLSENLSASRPRNARLLSGARELLEKIQTTTDHTLSLLTGNVENGAMIKTGHFGIDHYFSFGAFGNDHHDRNQLGPIAIERAREKTGREFTGNDVIVIGDTPRDIACARACGASVIAVATGTACRETLAQCEPDELFDDLSDTDKLLSALKK